MIDPHGEYSAAFKGCGELFNVDNLQLPYWLMNFEEHCEVILTTARRRASARRRHPRQVPARRPHQGQGHRASIGKVTVDSPDPVPADRPQRDHRQRDGQARHAPATRCPISASRPSSTSSAPIRATPSCSRACWCRTRWRASSPRCSACRATGRPISIVDVSGVPSDITSVVVSVLARMVFDYAIWSRTEAQRPMLLVCEEAHRYVPKDENPAAPGRPQDPRADRQGRP